MLSNITHGNIFRDAAPFLTDRVGIRTHFFSANCKHVTYMKFNYSKEDAGTQQSLACHKFIAGATNHGVADTDIAENLDLVAGSLGFIE